MEADEDGRRAIDRHEPDQLCGLIEMRLIQDLDGCRHRHCLQHPCRHAAIEAVERLGGVGGAMGRQELGDILWLCLEHALGHAAVLVGVRSWLTSNAAAAGNRVSVSVKTIRPRSPTTARSADCYCRLAWGCGSLIEPGARRRPDGQSEMSCCGAPQSSGAKGARHNVSDLSVRRSMVNAALTLARLVSVSHLPTPSDAVGPELREQGAGQECAAHRLRLRKPTWR